MPYNNTAIPPPEEITAHCSLPMARIKKIINLDEDVASCSTNAAFVMTIATEMFVQYIAEQGHNVVKSERKPRRNIQYRDIANAVARIDNLEFLSDVVPRTMPYKQYKEKKSKEATNGDAAEAERSVIERSKVKAPAQQDATESEEEAEEDAEEQEQVKLEIRGSRANGGRSSGVQSNGTHADDVSMA